MIAHSRYEIRHQTDGGITRTLEVVSPRNHLHHAARARRAHGKAIRVDLVQGKQRIDLIVERESILSAEAFVIHMFDNAQTFSNVDQHWRNRDALLTQTLRSEIEHVAHVPLT